MASETLLAEDTTRERHRVDKVYTRKFRNKQNSGASQNGSAITNANGTSTASHITSCNGNGAKSRDRTSDGGDVSGVSNEDATTANNGDVTMAKKGATVAKKGATAIADTGDTVMVDAGGAVMEDNGDAAISDNGDVISGGDDTAIATRADVGIAGGAVSIDCKNVPQQSKAPQTEHLSLQLQEGGQSPQLLEGAQSPQQLEGGHSPHLQENSQWQLHKGGSSRSQLESGGSLWQPQEEVQQLEVGSDDDGHGRPITTRVGDRLNINLAVARSAKQETRRLKRKLMEELDEVRNLAKKLKGKEDQLYSTGAGANGDTGAGMLAESGYEVDIDGYGQLQHPANRSIEKGSDIRVHPDVSLGGVDNTRSIRQLTVSVMDHGHGFSENRENMEKEKRTPKANQYYRNSDFILGKEKFPPAESNKRQKSASKKRSGGDFGFGMDKQLIKSCGNLLQKLMKHRYSWVFNKPVDVKGLALHDYFDIIKQPMDLGTVKNRLQKNWYKSPRAFAEDVRLTFHNAMTYNPEGQDVHIMAQELLQLFEENWMAIDAQYNHRPRYEMADEIGFLTPTSRNVSMPFPARVSVSSMSAPSAPLLRPPPMQQPMKTLGRPELITVPAKPIYNAPLGRTTTPRKPKAKDPVKRDMTFEEKQKLSANLQDLPSEKLDNIVQIIKKRNSAFSQHDDEIEVDIDSCDAETLWELDRFVTNYKKSLSKNKRRAELALQRAEASQAVQGINFMAQQTEALTEPRAVDEHQATASSVHEATRPDNATQSSSSSGSSSGSGSSSSDSDSDSSSGSSSDEGH